MEGLSGSGVAVGPHLWASIRSASSSPWWALCVQGASRSESTSLLLPCCRWRHS